MSKQGKHSKRNRTLKTGKPTGWAVALEAAHKHLRNNRLQAARLRIAIRLFTEKLANGEPFPMKNDK